MNQLSDMKELLYVRTKDSEEISSIDFFVNDLSLRRAIFDRGRASLGRSNQKKQLTLELERMQQNYWGNKFVTILCTKINKKPK